MGVIIWYFFITVCIFSIHYSVGKPVSLNEIIAEESRRSESVVPYEDSVRVPASLNKASQFLSRTQQKNRADILTPLRSKLSALVKTKTNNDYNPIKQKKHKNILSTQLNRRQTLKRHVIDHGKHKQSHIPLLRRLRMLLDDLISSGTNDVSVVKKYRSEQRRDTCKCPSNHDAGTSESRTHQKTVAFTTSVTTEVPIQTESPTTETTTTTSSNIFNLRQNTNLPLLSTRNSLSRRRNYNGVSERSSPTLYRNSKRPFSRNIRNSKYATRSREDKADTTNDDKNTDNITRYSSISDGIRGRIRGNNTKARIHPFHFKSIQSTKIDPYIGRHYEEPEGETKFQNRRDKTESAIFLSKPNGGLRRHVSQKEISNTTEILRAPEIEEESYIDDTVNNSSNQSGLIRGSIDSTENQDVRSTNETMTLENYFNSNFTEIQPPKSKNAVVMIIDGYSVAKEVW